MATRRYMAVGCAIEPERVQHVGGLGRLICFDRNQQRSNASPNNIQTATFWPGEYHPVMVETDAGLTISHACVLPWLDGHHGS